LSAGLALGSGGLTPRLGWLMMVKRGELTALAERQYSRTVVLPALRGPILDRRGAPLATSTATESLFVQPRSVGDPVRVAARPAPLLGPPAPEWWSVQPRRVGDPVRVAARLAPILGQPEREVHATLTSARPFVWLRR